MDKDQPVQFAIMPLTLNRRAALDFTGIAPKLFDELVRQRSITGRKIGRNGQTIYLRAELERVVRDLFGQADTDIDDEFDLT